MDHNLQPTENTAAHLLGMWEHIQTTGQLFCPPVRFWAIVRSGVGGPADIAELKLPSCWLGMMEFSNIWRSIDSPSLAIVRCFPHFGGQTSHLPGFQITQGAFMSREGFIATAVQHSTHRGQWSQQQWHEKEGWSQRVCLHCYRHVVEIAWMRPNDTPQCN